MASHSYPFLSAFDVLSCAGGPSLTAESCFVHPVPFSNIDWLKLKCNGCLGMFKFKAEAKAEL